jgi:endonuclease YncB( thermonuclease family)
VTLDLGFKTRHQEILRLAKIGAAELATAAGKRAAKALQEILKDAPFLVIKTNKTDIYGRYIADVFFGEKSETDPQKVADSGTYLNQLLLERGLVELY